jgi:hypothetical protein
VLKVFFFFSFFNLSFSESKIETVMTGTHFRQISSPFSTLRKTNFGSRLFFRQTRVFLPATEEKVFRDNPHKLIPLSEKKTN